MNLQLNNKTALITGSTAGIGYATQTIIAGRRQCYYQRQNKGGVDAAIASLQKKILSKVSG
jgi:NAD(P)-dependent dehydrogenase (short-subunit alcohol dehydrogenase family)